MVALENLHFTLRFLGATPGERATRIAAAMACLGEVPHFEIDLEGLGQFPLRGRPDVLWLGVGKGTLELKALSVRVDGLLGDLGFSVDPRPFAPHLTLARLKRPPASARGVLDAVSPKGAGTFAVAEVVLYRSDLTPAGAVHTALARVALEGTATPTDENH